MLGVYEKIAKKIGCTSENLRRRCCPLFRKLMRGKMGIHASLPFSSVCVRRISFIVRLRAQTFAFCSFPPFFSRSTLRLLLLLPSLGRSRGARSNSAEKQPLGGRPVAAPFASSGSETGRGLEINAHAVLAACRRR